jgi:hypothetical protein
MPPLLHERAAGVRSRIEALTSTTTPTWGRMSVDQMLHHGNLVLAESLGEHTAAKHVKGLPEPLVRWAIINMPWGKGAPTRPARAANFAMTGKHWSQLQFKHLDHHLKQFGL